MDHDVRLGKFRYAHQVLAVAAARCRHVGFEGLTTSRVITVGEKSYVACCSSRADETVTRTALSAKNMTLVFMIGSLKIQDYQV